MAAETEGIALLSMYGDEEEEEESAVVVEEEEGAAVMLPEDVGNEEGDENLQCNYMKNDYPPQSFLSKSPQPLISPSPLRSLDDSDSKTLIIGSPFLQQNLMPLLQASRSQLSSPFSLSSPSPPAPVAPPSLPEHSDGQRPRIKSLAIVDYAQDEAAMSPDAEAMEIGNNGRVVFGTEVHISDGLQKAEGTTPVPSQALTPNTQQQEFFLPFDAHEQLKSEATISMEFSGKELEVAEVITSSVVSTDMQIDTLLQSFLPPVVATKCSVELQEKINKFLAYKRAGKSFNADLRNRKDYRNPNFLQHAVSYQDIDEIGTCFSKEVFDPHGYSKSDYYDEIEADMKRELERKEQERKKNQKIDFVSGGSQPGGASSALKMNAPSPGVSTLPNCSLPPNSTSCDATRDNRTNKKSKWDKVDGDTKMPSGGHDNPPSVSIHAAHLSAANAGSGYSAFAQLKRREAEEKKLGERKFDKRS